MFVSAGNSITLKSRFSTSPDSDLESSQGIYLSLLTERAKSYFTSRKGNVRSPALTNSKPAKAKQQDEEASEEDYQKIDSSLLLNRRLSPMKKPKRQLSTIQIW